MKRLTFRPTYPGSGQHVADNGDNHVVITWVGDAFEVEHYRTTNKGRNVYKRLAYRKTWKAAVAAAVRMAS